VALITGKKHTFGSCGRCLSSCGQKGMPFTDEGEIATGVHSVCCNGVDCRRRDLRVLLFTKCIVGGWQLSRGTGDPTLEDDGRGVMRKEREEAPQQSEQGSQATRPPVCRLGASRNFAMKTWKTCPLDRTIQHPKTHTPFRDSGLVAQVAHMPYPLTLSSPKNPRQGSVPQQGRALPPYSMATFLGPSCMHSKCSLSLLT